ncbi:hypothetical protein LTSEADE_0970, partial [Salmonella enterica subsp. enterica serovar Adelaide str. A4-669]
MQRNDIFKDGKVLIIDKREIQIQTIIFYLRADAVNRRRPLTEYLRQPILTRAQSDAQLVL